MTDREALKIYIVGRIQDAWERSASRYRLDFRFCTSEAANATAELDEIMTLFIEGRAGLREVESAFKRFIQAHVEHRWFVGATPRLPEPNEFIH